MKPFIRLTPANPIGDDETTLLSDYLRRLSGIVIPPMKSYLFETRLTKMMADAGCETYRELYNYIVSGIDPQAEQKLINAMTTNETLWFRDSTPWQVLDKLLLPELTERLDAGRKSRVRIWSAAVSTGQEAYSTAMCIDRYLQAHPAVRARLPDFEILATDISSHVLEIARRGRYDAISIMRGLDEAYKLRYFTQDGSAWELDPRIRDSVTFKRFNLQRSFQPLGTFDIIFCRYVLIYFSGEFKRELIVRLHDSLAEGGVLFTGSYVLSGLYEDLFDEKHYHNLTYYTKKAVKK